MLLDFSNMTDVSVIFDLDGTLVDTAPDLHASLNHSLKQAGRETVEIEQVRHMVGQGARVLLKRGLTATGGIPEDEEFEQLVTAFFEYYQDHLADTSLPYDGVISALDLCRSEGYKLGVCTNKPYGFALPLLQKLDMTGYFAGITGGDSFDYRKPDARHISGTLTKMGVTGGKAIMIGDSENDILAATNARIPSIAVTFGYTAIPVQELGPDHVIDHFDELVPLIKSLT
jgi:phosphoglycolate phosphatase